MTDARFRGLRCGAGREIDAKGSFHAEDRPHNNRTVMLGDNGVHGGQAETAAGLLGGKVGVKDSRQNVRGNPASMVENRDNHVPAAAQRESICVEYHVFSVHFDDSAFRHRLPGIEQNVVERLTDLFNVDLRRPEVSPDDHIDGDLSSGSSQVYRVLDDSGQRNWPANRSTTLPEGQELRSQGGGSFTR